MLKKFSAYGYLVFSLFLTFAVSQFLTDSRVANAGMLPEVNCQDASGNRISRRIDENLGGFSEISKSNERYSITVNPTEFYYLSRESQEWLYLRECARIRFGYDISQQSRIKQNLREERKIDCEALKLMADDSKGSPNFYSVERKIKTIERDLAGLEANQWRSIFGGSRRRTDLQSCAEEF